MKFFTIRLLIFVILCSAFISSQAHTQTPYTWLPIGRITTNQLKAVYFVDSLTGWAAGKNGVVFKTTNEGNSWIAQDSKLSHDIVEIFMLNSRKGWLLANKILQLPDTTYATYLLSTEDGGDSWDSIEFPFEIFYSVTFLDSLHGWLGGEKGKLIGTSDGGLNWNDATIDTPLTSNRPIKKIRFWSPQFGIAAGGEREFAAVFRRTTNGGASWKVIRTGSDAVNDFQFIDSSTLVGVGGGLDEGAITSRSIDSGLTWNFQLAGTWGIIAAVDFCTSSEGFAPVLAAQEYLHTLDSGKTWTPYQTPDHLSVTDIDFIDEHHGFMVGDSGSVYRYNPSKQITVSSFWNIVSLPVSLTDSSKNALFPGAISNAFAFTEAGYLTQDTLTNGVGYWLKFPSAQTYEFGGFPRLSDTIIVHAGWNMIGTLSEPVSAASITTEPPLALSSFFGYDNGYTVADTLFPGRGYWVKADSEGVILLNTSTTQAR